MVITPDRGSNPRTSTRVFRTVLAHPMDQQSIRHIDFMKMSGAGNDFVVVDNRSGIVSAPDVFAQQVCDRRRGIGADGLLLLEPSAKADFLMKYYNADGSYGGMCGNGGRCISRYAYLKHLVVKPEIRFEALEHIYAASVLHDRVRLEMKDPTDFRMDQDVEVAGRLVHFHFVNSGSPHCVIFLEENRSLGPDLDSVDVQAIGKEIRYHRSFSPAGTNVNFIEKNISGAYVIRTYERGVEAETLACGTGSVAAALIIHEVKNAPAPVSLQVRSGESLEIGFQKNGDRKYHEVSLSGSAHVVFSGKISYEFSSQSIVDFD